MVGRKFGRSLLAAPVLLGDPSVKQILRRLLVAAALLVAASQFSSAQVLVSSDDYSAAKNGIALNVTNGVTFHVLSWAPESSAAVTGCLVELLGSTDQSFTVNVVTIIAPTACNSAGTATNASAAPSAWVMVVTTGLSTGKVNITYAGYRSQPSAASGSSSVSVSNTPLPVSLSGTTATQDTANGATGSAVPARGMVAAGKNGSGNTTDMSVDASGNLGVNIQNTPAVSVSGTAATQDAASGTTGSAVPAKGMVAAGKNGSGNTQDISVDASGNQNMNIVNTPAVTATNSSGSNFHVNVDNNTNTVSGSITTTQCVTISALGTGAVGMNIAGTWTGTISFTYSDDGTNWFAALGVPVPSAQAAVAAPVTSSTANGSWIFSSQGHNGIRACGNTVATGTATVTENSNPAPATNGLSYFQGLSTMIGTGAGTAPNGTEIVGAIFNNAAPSPSNGQTVPLQADANGNLKEEQIPCSTTTACSLSQFTNTSLTTAVVVKASTGAVYGFQIQNAQTSVCYVEFINAASSPTLGTNAVFSIAVPASGTVTLPPGAFALGSFATGVSVGMATTNNGSTACGVAGILTLFYK